MFSATSLPGRVRYQLQSLLFSLHRLSYPARANPAHIMSQGSEEVLPKPPVPELKSTLERYLTGIKAIVDSEQFNHTKSLVNEFQKPGGTGECLQDLLKKYAGTADNWVTGFWLDDMYLKNPLSLPVNSSPFFMLPKQAFNTTNEQLSYVSKFVVFSLKYKQKLQRRDLKQEYASGHGKGIPLCMNTYYRFFSSYRSPGLLKDTQIFNDYSKHIVVICRNQLFALHFPNDNPNEEAIFEKLRQIEKLSKQEPFDPPVGILTVESRPEWSKIYSTLSENRVNRESIKTIQECLYVLCLDDYLSQTRNGRKASMYIEPAAMASHLLHGNGTNNNSGNRWYDNFLQFVVTKDGVSGFVMEHSVSEGITVLRFCEEFLNFLENKAEKSPKDEGELKIEKLKWEITEPIAKAIQNATKKINKLVNDVDLYILKFDEYGKEFIKGQKISPDVYIQLALQLTHYKVYRKLVSTYESAALRKFKYGRVDNIRACTPEALNWVQAMCDVTQVEDEEKLNLFKEAVKKQTEILVYTINGEGPDNHLLGLKEIATMNNIKEPELFKDKSYKEFLNFRLSTSQLPSKHDIIVGYGPVVPNGYGCSYNPLENHITFCITSFNSSDITSSNLFAQSLEGSLLQMRELCTKSLQEEIKPSLRAD
ncbi:choline O-acetyltransferase isoform X1 [Centruroides vittatus]|uniref:choline O-acetyltransferase isoform X1 n=1 Tax=Centruroides vittatus TaxID=120091 RepID=UPI0035103231